VVLLDEHTPAGDLDREERCEPFIERDDGVLMADGDGLPVAPHGRFSCFYLLAREARVELDVEEPAAEALPDGIVQRVITAACRADHSRLHAVSPPYSLEKLHDMVK
jgi:hypothetical protein